MNYLYFDSLSKYPQIRHLVATRQVGNVSFSVEDDPENVLKNREKVALEIGASLDDFVVPGLVHGACIEAVGSKERGCGSRGPDTVIKETDALVTSQSGLVLMLPVADCVPILFFDPTNRAVGIAHAGWRGTLKGVVRKTVETLSRKYNTNPKDLLVGIGPAICVKHYEVDEAVLPGAKGNYDLIAANKIQLLEKGVCDKNIEIMPYCTFERTDLFFSHRAEKQTGRFATGIMLSEDD